MVIDTIRYDGLKYIDAYNADIVNNTTIGGNITVGGTSILTGTLTANGASTINNTLDVDPNSGSNEGIALVNSGGGLATLSIDSGYIKGNTTETLFEPQGGLLTVSTASSGYTELKIQNTTSNKAKLLLDGSSLYDNTSVLNIEGDGGVALSGKGTLSFINFYTGDTNTGFTGNVLSLVSLSESGGNFATGEVVVNEPGDDIDFRVETDTITNAFKVDAGSDTVETNAPFTTNSSFTTASTATFNNGFTASDDSDVTKSGIGNHGFRVSNGHASGNSIIKIGGSTLSDDGTYLRLNASDRSDIGVKGSLPFLVLNAGSTNSMNDKEAIRINTITESTGDYATGEIVVNADQADMDFKIYTGSTTDAFIIDSGADTVKTNVPFTAVDTFTAEASSEFSTGPVTFKGTTVTDLAELDLSADTVKVNSVGVSPIFNIDGSSSEITVSRPIKLELATSNMARQGEIAYNTTAECPGTYTGAGTTKLVTGVTALGYSATDNSNFLAQTNGWRAPYGLPDVSLDVIALARNPPLPFGGRIVGIDSAVYTTPDVGFPFFFAVEKDTGSGYLPLWPSATFITNGDTESAANVTAGSLGTYTFAAGDKIRVVREMGLGPAATPDYWQSNIFVVFDVEC